jgi:flagellar biosynthesis protein FlhA
MTEHSFMQRILKRADLFLAIAVVGIIVMMVLPVPPVFLDMLLALNIMLALLILLVSLYTVEPLHLSIFPGFLLILTLFRLAMNVASTRLILGHGFAGKVIQAFGDFVAGGNLVVGFIVFLVLVLINFIVITKGAGRVAEVAARFTLDAMPGKQMAIDADMNNGLIDEKEARKRRETITREADFYGAMDGASKFVRGDAVAGLVITGINLLGGLAVGSMQLGMSLSESARTFSLLTVGDGLVNQIPSLIVSAAAGIIVTRAGSKSRFGEDLARQLLWQSKPLMVSAGVLALFAIVPGLPTLPFLVLSLASGTLAWRVRQAEKERVEVKKNVKTPAKKAERVEDYLALDTMEIELGYRLVPLVDQKRGGDFLGRVTRLRRELAGQLGFILPAVRIRDDMGLEPNHYRIRIRGVVVAEDFLRLGAVLALGAPESAARELRGEPTTDPTFGLPAIWIPQDQASEAESRGWATIEAAAVLATHLEVVSRRQSWRILSRQDVRRLMDNLKPDHQALIDDITPGQLSLGQIHKVLQKLLREGIPIRDLLSILETLSDTAEQTKDPDLLAEYARFSLSDTITAQVKENWPSIKAITLDPDLEALLSRERDGTQAGHLSPDAFAKVIQRLKEFVGRLQAEGRKPVLITRPEIRSYVRRLLEGPLPDLMILAYSELSMDAELESMAQVGLEPAESAPLAGARGV